MEHNDPFGFVGLTYDDVLLLPGHTSPAAETADRSNNSPLDNKSETDSPNVKSGSQTRDARANVAETKNEAAKPQRPEDSGPAT